MSLKVQYKNDPLHSGEFNFLYGNVDHLMSLLIVRLPRDLHYTAVQKSD